MKKIALSFLLLWALQGAAHAQNNFQPLETIRAAAVAALAISDSERSSAEVVLDSSLRMPRCNTTLTAHAIGPGTVEVGCPAPLGWRLFVPVRLNRIQEVLVLTRTVAAGEMLTADLFVSQARDLARIPGAALTDAAAAIGRSARRTLLAGSTISPAHLAAATTIHRGDAVVLVAQMGSTSVRAAGRALADAGIDDRLAVENISSRRVLQGRVLASGEVEIGK